MQIPRLRSCDPRTTRSARDDNVNDSQADRAYDDEPKIEVDTECISYGITTSTLLIAVPPRRFCPVMTMGWLPRVMG